MVEENTQPIEAAVAAAPMDLHVSLIDRRDLSGEIYRQLRAAILQRRLTPGERLPPTRELAARLGCHERLPASHTTG